MMFACILTLHFFLYTNFHHHLPGLRLVLILSLALLVSLLFRKPTIVNSKIWSTLCLLIGWFAISVIFSNYRGLSFDYLINFIKVVAVAFVTYASLTSIKRLKIFLHCWLFYHVIIVLNSLLVYRIDDSAHRYGAAGYASTGFMGDANDFALGLNIALPFAFYLMLDSKKLLFKVLLSSCILLFVVGIVISNSRGGFLTLVVVIFTMLMQSQKKVIGIILVVASAVCLLYFAPGSYVDRLGTLADGSAMAEGDTGYGRLALWKAGLKMMFDHPLTGVGLGRYLAAYGYEYHREGDTKWRVSHNTYISVGAETGTVGLLVYLYLLYFIFEENRFIQTASYSDSFDRAFLSLISKALLTSLFAYFCGTLFLTAYYYIHLYLIMALTLTIKFLLTNESTINISEC